MKMKEEQNQLTAKVKNAIVDHLKTVGDTKVTCFSIFYHLLDDTEVYRCTDTSIGMTDDEAKEFTAMCIKEMANAGFVKLDWLNDYSLTGFLLRRVECFYENAVFGKESES